MKLINISTRELAENKDNEYPRIYLFGAGKILHVIESGLLAGLGDRIAYVIDNSLTESIHAFGRDIEVRRPDALTDELAGLVLITSYVHLADMYEQLAAMNLPDSIECCFYPFMQMEERHTGIAGSIERHEDSGTLESNETNIPKTIHTFWFGGTEMPDEYKRCIDSWYRICPDYEINIWNRNTYDCNKHPFMRRAVELEAWAYAADYARLDTVYERGGIYLDSDIELVKAPESMLRFASFFGFVDQGDIDLAAFGSVPRNPLVGSLLDLYDDIELPDTKEGFTRYFQPFFVFDRFREYGVTMDGELQFINDNVFLPREVMFPMDTIIYDKEALTDDTVMIHHNNAGWKADGYKEIKRRRCLEIYRLLEGR